MLTIENHAKSKLDRGELALGVLLRQARTVDIGRAMKTAGYNWLFIDMEHNAMGVDIATQIAVAAQDAGITPLIRVPGFEHHHASRALDCGAQGIIAPHVDDAATAKRIVDACRYPPLGARSVYGVAPQLGFAAHPPAETAAALNASTLVVVMIESRTGVANAAEIAATPGVDVVLVGASDLTMAMGVPGQFDHPEFDAAMAAVAGACQSAGVHMGLGGIYDPAVIQRYMAKGDQFGARLVLAGGDLGFLMTAASAQAKALRNLAQSPA